MTGKGFCLWLNGPGASGKTTLAGLLKKTLQGREVRVEVLDEETVPQIFSPASDLGPEDLETRLRILGFTAKLLARNNVAVLVDVANPLANLQKELRDQINNYLEVFLDCPLETLAQRNPDMDARTGETSRQAGLEIPLATPSRPDLVLRTGEESADESLARILTSLEIFGLIPAEPSEGYSREEIGELEKRLGELGYL